MWIAYTIAMVAVFIAAAVLQSVWLTRPTALATWFLKNLLLLAIVALGIWIVSQRGTEPGIARVLGVVYASLVGFSFLLVRWLGIVRRPRHKRQEVSVADYQAGYRRQKPIPL